jgi:hypothetical protein
MAGLSYYTWCIMSLMYSTPTEDSLMPRRHERNHRTHRNTYDHRGYLQTVRCLLQDVNSRSLPYGIIDHTRYCA